MITLKHRRATAAVLTAANPVLAAGEIVVETDTGRIKIGNGSTAWASLAYITALAVQKTGDTMTGKLTVKPAVVPALPDGTISVIGDNTLAAVVASYYSTATNSAGVWQSNRARGTHASPLPVANGDILGQVGFRGLLSSGVYQQGFLIFSICNGDPIAGDTRVRTITNIGTQIYISSNQDGLTSVGYTGIGWSTPTNTLEVGGTTKLRDTLEVVGNITSTGTAHNFAASSIPSAAVIGSAANTPAASSASGTAGSMRWDASYLYLCTGANTWKRVALSSF